MSRMWPCEVQALGISEKHKACCRRAGIFNAAQLVLLPPKRLSQALRLDADEAEVVRVAACVAMAPPPRSVSDLLGLDDVGSEDETDPPHEESGFPNSAARQRAPRGGSSAPSAKALGKRKARGSRPDAGSSPWHRLCDAVAAADLATRLSTGQRGLDDLLGGGIRIGTVVDLVGESSCGKTQIVLQAAVHLALGLRAIGEHEERIHADEVDGGAESSYDKDHADDSAVEYATPDLAEALGGVGCSLAAAPVGGVALLTPGGQAQASLLTRRMLEMAEAAVLSRRRLAEHAGLFDPAESVNTTKRRRHQTSRSSDNERHPRPTHRGGENSVDGSSEKANGGIEADAAVVAMAKGILLRNVHVACVADLEALQHAVLYTLPGLMTRLAERSETDKSAIRDEESGSSGDSQTASSSTSAGRSVCPKPIRLVVVEDLPAILHASGQQPGTLSLVQRSKALGELADALKRLSLLGCRDGIVGAGSGRREGRAGCAAVCVNHVSDAFREEREVATAALAAVRATAVQSAHGIQQINHDDAPLVASAQSVWFSGLMASTASWLGSTGERTTSDDQAVQASQADIARNGNGPMSAEVESPLKMAQLGLPWANAVTARVMLCRTPMRAYRAKLEAALSKGKTAGRLGSAPRSFNEGTAALTGVRQARVVFGPFEPSVQAKERTARKTRQRDLLGSLGGAWNFAITRAGAVEVHDGALVAPQTSAADETMWGSEEEERQILAALNAAEEEMRSSQAQAARLG